MSTQELICVGKLLSPHGVRGEIKFLCYLEDPRPLRKAKTLFDANGKAYDLESVRTAPKERLLLKLKGLETPEDALLFCAKRHKLIQVLRLYSQMANQ